MCSFLFCVFTVLWSVDEVTFLIVSVIIHCNYVFNTLDITDGPVITFTAVAAFPRSVREIRSGLCPPTKSGVGAYPTLQDALIIYGQLGGRESL